MMRASSAVRHRHLLVCDRMAGRTLARNSLGSLVVAESPRMVVFDVSGRQDRVRNKALALGLMLTPRYMDEFYFCMMPHAGPMARRLVAEFFGWIAESYHRRVDLSRNRENARNLLELVCARTEHPGRIVDFGCGIGLAKPVADELDLELVGYEPDQRMRMRASKVGLDSWGHVDLFPYPRNSLRGAIASYVLHLPGVLVDLEGVWRTLLRPGAILAANFHKSEGRTQTVKALEQWGARIESVASPEPSRRHGDYVVFHRA